MLSYFLHPSSILALTLHQRRTHKLLTLFSSCEKPLQLQTKQRLFRFAISTVGTVYFNDTLHCSACGTIACFQACFQACFPGSNCRFCCHLHLPVLGYRLFSSYIRDFFFFLISERLTIINLLVGGYLASSLAVMTDAGHLLTDVSSFLISILALKIASRPISKKMTFGWHRAGMWRIFSLKMCFCLATTAQNHVLYSSGHAFDIQRVKGCCFFGHWLIVYSVAC